MIVLVVFEGVVREAERVGPDRGRAPHRRQRQVIQPNSLVRGCIKFFIIKKNLYHVSLAEEMNRRKRYIKKKRVL